MTPQSRRRLIPILVLLAATGVLLAIIFGSKRASNSTEPIEPTTTIVAEVDSSDPIVPETPPVPEIENIQASVPSNTSDASTLVAPFDVLQVKQHEIVGTPIILGALDDINTWQMEVTFTQSGAGITSIRFSNIFETVDGKLAWGQYRENGGTTPPIDELYLLTTDKTADQLRKPVLGAFQVQLNEQRLPLSDGRSWAVVDTTEQSVTFKATVIDTHQNDIVTIKRTWTLDNQYGLQLEQSVQNLTSQEMDVRWLQYGPSTLTVDRSRYMDRRRFRFGWELGDEFDPNQSAPIQSNDFYLEFTDITKEKETSIWPTAESIEEGFKLSWFASTNRYFALAVFPNINVQGQGTRVFTDKVSEITSRVEGSDSSEFVLTGLWSPVTRVAGGGIYDLSMGVYAGPLKRSVLDNEEPYVTLNMRDLVLYQMSSMCAFCTFQWLADFLAVLQW